MTEIVLSPKQKRAITALLTCRTVEDAALTARVTSKTLRRWLDLPAFRAALTQAETQVIADSVRSMVSDMSDNRDVLISIRDKALKDADRLRAAAIIDNSLLRWRELGILSDLDERLKAVEEKTNSGGK